MALSSACVSPIQSKMCRSAPPGSVKNAEERLTEPFIVISGDALTDYNLTDIINYHNEKKSMATLLLAHVPNPLEYGVIITNEDGHISQFLEKPSWGEVFSDTINTGIYVLDPKIFAYFEKNKPFDFSQELFPMMLKKGDPIYGYVANSGYWCDVGSLPEYMRANADVLQGRVDVEIPAKNVGDSIWCEDGVEISSDAQLYGPLYLAHDCKIKAGAIVHGPSTIGHYTIIDERAQVDRSIVWNNSYIGERAELRGALVGSSTSIKSKAVMFEAAPRSRTAASVPSLRATAAPCQPRSRKWSRMAPPRLRAPRTTMAGMERAYSLVVDAEARRPRAGGHLDL